MIFQRKSRLERASDAMLHVLEAMGSTGRGGRRLGKLRRARQGLSFVAFAAPIVWSNREKIRKAADSALQQAQQKLEASKRIFTGGTQEKQQPQGQQQPQGAQPKAA